MERFRIFIDVDGVLADFTPHIKVYSGSPLRHLDINDHKQIVHSRDFWDSMPKKWYRNMPETEECHSLMRLLNPEKNPWDLAILTSPYCNRRVDRICWCKDRWPKIPVICSESKENYCKTKKDLLIDDFEFNVAFWQSKGGKTILFKRPWNCKSKKRIEEYYPTGFLKHLLNEISPELTKKELRDFLNRAKRIFGSPALIFTE